jgi:NAD(P)-dependent dehydrogenase (short-subunit alcohol dehydrogenase family)
MALAAEVLETRCLSECIHSPAEADMELEHRVALVTGAGSGIGKASAVKLAQAGAKVIVHAHKEDETKATVDEIFSNGGDAFGATADLLDEHAMRDAIERGVDYFGALQIVVANAGINGVWAPIEELQPAEWDKTLNTNLRGAYLTLHYSVPHLKRAGSGSIVIISSINGTRVFSHGGASAYSTTKAGLLALGQMAALELAKHRIRVNVICPGKVDTEIDENTEARSMGESSEPAEYPGGKIPLTDGQPGTSNDIADAVLFLSSDRARYITGTPIWIDGGQSLLVG